MIPASFKYEVNLRVELTREEVELLTNLCLHHYDRAVRALVEPGEGAVLNAFRNHLLYTDPGGKHATDTAEGLFTYRQLDTLAKGLESAKTPKEQKLSEQVKKLMKLVAEERRRVDQNELAAPLLWVG